MVVSRSYVVLLEMTVLHPSKHCRALGSRAQRYAEEDEGVELRLLAPTVRRLVCTIAKTLFFLLLSAQFGPSRQEIFHSVRSHWRGELPFTILTRRMHRVATASEGPMLHHAVP